MYIPQSDGTLMMLPNTNIVCDKWEYPNGKPKKQNYSALLSNTCKMVLNEYFNCILTSADKAYWNKINQNEFIKQKNICKLKLQKDLKQYSCNE